jgi:hypothetical protein
MSTPVINKATQKSLANLEKVIDQFGDDFEEWASSRNGPLSAKELAIILSYRTHKTHLIYANSISRPSRHVSVIYNKAARKLQLPGSLSRYDKYKAYKNLLSQGWAKQDADLSSMIESVVELKISASFLAILLNAFSKAKLERDRYIILDELDFERDKIEVVNHKSRHDAYELTKEHLRAVLYITS